MSAILLISIIQVIFLSFFLVIKKDKNISDFVLILWLLVTTIPLFIYYINYDEYFYILKNSTSFPSWLMRINLFLFLVHSPFIYIYISASIKQKINYLQLLYFLPAVLFFFIINVFYDFSDFDKINFLITNLKYSIILISFFPITIFFVIFIIFKSLKLIKQYSVFLKDNSSNINIADIIWLKTIIYINIIFWIIFLFLTIIKKVNAEINLQNLPFILILIFIFIISFVGFKRPNIFIKYSNNTSKELKNNKIVINDNDVENDLLLKKLFEYIEKEKPYLNPELSLSNLAEYLNIPSYKLSKILNEQIGKTFFDFINFYRVEEVKKQLQENKNYKIIAIAYDCGFNSKSSFNRIFKKYTGKTPSQFITNL